MIVFLFQIEYFVTNDINIVDVAVGAEHSLALAADGRLYAWGKGGNGQLGISQAALDGEGLLLTPSQVTFPDGAKIAKIACGHSTSMALSVNGILFTFGSQGTGHNMDYPVLDPMPLDLSVALPNSAIAKILQMDGGASHGCLLVDVKDSTAHEKVETVD